MAKIGKRKLNRLVQIIYSIIEKHTYLNRDGDGYYQQEIYADYRDEFDDATIVNLFKDNIPREKFYELLNFDESEWYYQSELINTIKKYFNDEDEKLDFCQYEDFICDWLLENVHFNYPYDHYLNQDVYIDIIVDAGDGNYEYTKNELFGCNYSEKGLDGRDESALVWLMRQQGYGMDAITDFVENENLQDSKLLKSIYQECVNTSTCMNALAFFVKLSLREALDLYELVKQNNETAVVVLDKDTPCGLYDTWNGAGSVLDIELEKDVELPVKFIDSAMPDGCRGYSVANIYGMLRSFWADGGLTIKVTTNNAA